VLEIAFRPDRSARIALDRQLTDHLAALIETGRLAPGAKLPASREAAGALGVARNTVSAAYAALATWSRPTSGRAPSSRPAPSGRRP
jgi:GntR family transcriptional regulator/MocR family aminotransferase